jgi:hypothetical protein
VVLPQALRIAIPPTVGFLVQVIKGTALASVIGFIELTKAGTMITNATFKPFVVYSCVALLYFALCYPISLYADPGKELHGRCPPSLPRPSSALRKSLRRNEVLKGIDLRCSRRGDCHHRQERLGQEHAAALHQRAGGVPGRRAVGGRPSRCCTTAPRPCASCASAWA